jgi:hypothetical protein
MSGTRVTRAMVRDAAARAFPTGGWRVQQDMVTDRWEVARWGRMGTAGASCWLGSRRGRCGERLR